MFARDLDQVAANTPQVDRFRRLVQRLVDPRDQLLDGARVLAVLGFDLHGGERHGGYSRFRERCQPAAESRCVAVRTRAMTKTRPPMTLIAKTHSVGIGAGSTWPARMACQCDVMLPNAMPQPKPQAAAKKARPPNEDRSRAAQAPATKKAPMRTSSTNAGGSIHQVPLAGCSRRAA